MMTISMATDNDKLRLRFHRSICIRTYAYDHTTTSCLLAKDYMVLIWNGKLIQAAKHEAGMHACNAGMCSRNTWTWNHPLYCCAPGPLQLTDTNAALEEQRLWWVEGDEGRGTQGVDGNKPTHHTPCRSRTPHTAGLPSQRRPTSSSPAFQPGSKSSSSRSSRWPHSALARR